MAELQAAFKQLSMKPQGSMPIEEKIAAYRVQPLSQMNSLDLYEKHVLARPISVQRISSGAGLLGNQLEHGLNSVENKSVNLPVDADEPIVAPVVLTIQSPPIPTYTNVVDHPETEALTASNGPDIDFIANDGMSTSIVFEGEPDSGELEFFTTRAQIAWVGSSPTRILSHRLCPWRPPVRGEIISHRTPLSTAEHIRMKGDSSEETKKHNVDQLSGGNSHLNTDDLPGCRAEVAAQAEKIRIIKKGNGDKTMLDKEISKLLELKNKLASLELSAQALKPLYTRCRQELENLAKRRSFFFPSFEIYGGIAGLFDWGPPGCALKAELESLWRRFFVLNEEMLEISGTCLTPHAVLKTSGHVDRFCDLMTSDSVTGDCFRADKLLEDFIEGQLAQSQKLKLTENHIKYLESLFRQAGALSASELHELFTTLKVMSPLGNPVAYPFPFNLMFKTHIGPKEEEAILDSGIQTGTGYLRPETAQGIFVNFRRLLEYNAGKMPFAVAQLGLGFRNEIAPRNGLLRVREFQMAEIEYFVDPDDKRHPKFHEVAHLTLPLFPKGKQLSDGLIVRDITLKDAVNNKIINNESLAYFMARSYLFITMCGVQSCGLRFRQHLDSEMAHYASDCWDLDIETSYGWVECIGHADRAAYDLTHHSKATKTNLVAMKRYDEPKLINVVQMIPNKQIIGPALKKNQAVVLEALEEKSDEEKLRIEDTLEKHGTYILKLCTGESFTLTRSMISFKNVSQKVSEEAYVPGVIEPSFGIGRIIYCILEHSFRSRGIQDQEERCYLALPAVIAPIKCSVLAISSNVIFEPLIQKIKMALTQRSISCKVDLSTASIGKRYARTDEIGIPYGITVDFQSVQDDSVTIRERDSMEQIRIPFLNIATLLSQLITAELSWEEAKTMFPIFVEQEVPPSRT